MLLLKESVLSLKEKQHNIGFPTFKLNCLQVPKIFYD